MDRRLKLHNILVEILGASNVYFQPPETIKMTYPCIVYIRNSAKTDFANNFPYQYTKRYEVTVIDENPDSEIPGKVASLPMCSFSRHFTSDNLNHDVFNLYF